MTSNGGETKPVAPSATDLPLGEILLALAAPLAWAVHFMLAYLAAEGACRLGLLGGPWLGLTGLGWFIVAATVLALGLIAWAGLRALGRWRSTRAERAAALALGPRELLSLAGWSLALVFGALVVLSVVPLVVLRPCAWL
jgi:hypothetical protein